MLAVAGLTGYVWFAFLVPVVIALFLLGHYLIARMAEKKDALVVKAIQQFDADEDIIESRRHRLMEADEEDEFDSAPVSSASRRAYQDQSTGI